ncbi:transposase [Silvanigrella paludirubra]|uniref:Transposase n=1 Tax=Silvanigrella paludirubra TaxID=2499159 RepID=A0A6N6VWZ8_9BACT|nr:transposase [Silvanigrella paludirubra]KAB8040841.1 transposase [Silvanigrella paludirubra]
MRCRRRFTAEEKLRIVEETLQPESSTSSVSRKYRIQPSQLYVWRRLMKEGQMEAVEAEEKVVPISELKALQKKIHELERILGRKTLEVEILKEAVKIGREKKLISQEPLQGLGDFK